MNPPDKPTPGQEASKPKLSRSEEALRVIEEYASALRAIIERLRRKLH
jgi:hypothetical protein